MTTAVNPSLSWSNVDQITPRRKSPSRSSAEGTQARIGLVIRDPATAPCPRSATVHLDAIRRQLMMFSHDDREAAKFLTQALAAAPDADRIAISLELRALGYRGRQLDALKEWAYDRLHPADNAPSALRPVRPVHNRPRGPSGFVRSAGLPGLGRRR